MPTTLKPRANRAQLEEHAQRSLDTLRREKGIAPWVAIRKRCPQLIAADRLRVLRILMGWQSSRGVYIRVITGKGDA